MTEKRVLTARAYRDGGTWWTIEIPELTSPGPGGTTITAVGGAVNARSLDAAARELAAVWLDVRLSQIEVTVRIEAPDSILQLWHDGEREESEAREAVRRAADKRRAAVRALRADGYSLEATASALGVSRQRVAQLAAEPGRVAKRRRAVG